MTPKCDIVFAATRPLGRLAKWMRLLGFDTLYEPEVTPALFEKRCQEGICLTRTRGSGERADGHGRLYIEADRVREQLQAVVSALGLKTGDLKPFSRCIGCNAVVEKVDKQVLKPQVPDYVWETHRQFSRCNRCRRIYWPGSHTRRTMEFIQTVFNSHDRQLENERT